MTSKRDTTGGLSANDRPSGSGRIRKQQRASLDRPADDMESQWEVTWLLESLQCRCHLLSPPSNPKPRKKTTTQILTHCRNAQTDVPRHGQPSVTRTASASPPCFFTDTLGGWRKQSNARKRPPKGKWERERFFPIQEVHRGDPEERKSHMNVPPGRAVVDCGPAKVFLEQNLQLCRLRLARNEDPKQDVIRRLRLWKRSTIFVNSENN